MIRKPYQFCPHCGHEMADRVVELEQKERRVCTSCAFIYYDNPTPAAGVIIVQDERVLLVERKYNPKAGMWTLPAGFVESGEDVATCAVRETKEETNLDVELDRIFEVYSAFDDPRAAVILILYVGKQVGGKLQCGDDASDASFFDINGLPENIAFRAHQQALADVQRAVAEGTL